MIPPSAASAMPSAGLGFWREPRSPGQVRSVRCWGPNPWALSRKEKVGDNQGPCCFLFAGHPVHGAHGGEGALGDDCTQRWCGVALALAVFVHILAVIRLAQDHRLWERSGAAVDDVGARTL